MSASVPDDTSLANPFRASRVAPGARPYELASSQTWEKLYSRFQALQRRGAVVGPHGAGKTTLLISCWQQWGRAETGESEWHWFRLRNSASPLRMRLEAAPSTTGEVSLYLQPAVKVSRGEILRSLHPAHTTVVDGYDAGPVWWRWRLQRRAIQRQASLLVTSHRETAIPTLIELTPTLADLQRLVACWQPAVTSIDEATLHSIWERHPGNLRECLFELYDWWESWPRA